MKTIKNNRVNPNHPNRKIRHADLMIKAGFEINPYWYVNRKEARKNPPTEKSKLIFWRHKKIKSLKISLFDWEFFSLEKLLYLLKDDIECTLKQNAMVTFRET